MSDEQVTVQPVQVDEQTTESLDDKLAEIEQRIEAKYKNEISGLNRKVTELTKEKEETEKSKLSEVEKLRIEQDAINKRLAEADAKALKMQAIAESGLDSAIISIESIDDPKERYAKLAEYINAKVNGKELEVKTKLKDDLGIEIKPGGDKVSIDMDRFNNSPSYAAEIKRTNPDLYSKLKEGK